MVADVLFHVCLARDAKLQSIHIGPQMEAGQRSRENQSRLSGETIFAFAKNLSHTLREGEESINRAPINNTAHNKMQDA